MATFEKPSTLIPDQIALLQQRGLTINGNDMTNHYLAHVGYYRLSGYWQFLQKNRVTHSFHTGTSFDQVIALYNFDRELRLLLLDAIERIEVSFRAILINQMCNSFGPNWFTDSTLAFNVQKKDEIIETINHELDRSGEEFIKHHDRKYGKAKHPPAWKTLQVLSFGTLSRIYGNIRKDIREKQIMAKVYGLPREEWLHSWMHALSVLRNYCAHHSRISYRIVPFPPKGMRSSMFPWIKQIPQIGSLQSQQLYYQLCIIRYLLYTASPGNDFGYKFMELLVKYPGIELDRMGFPENWDQEELWQ